MLLNEEKDTHLTNVIHSCSPQKEYMRTDLSDRSSTVRVRTIAFD